MICLASEKVTVLSAESFQQEVLESPDTILVDFWADWCGPCRMIAPVIDEIAEGAQPGLKVCKLDVDAYGAVAAQYGVLSIPTVIIFKNGAEMSRTVGVCAKEDLLQAVGFPAE